MNKKVSNLLLMVEFLHGMIENFKMLEDPDHFQPILEKVKQLDKEQRSCNCGNFYGNKRYEQIEKEILEVAEPIIQTIIEPIKSKVAELNFCDWHEDNTVWNWNIKGISDFKREAQEGDATLVVNNYRLYKEFKPATALIPHTHGFFEASYFFSRLDRTLNELYSYFNPETKAKPPEPQVIEIPKAKEQPPRESAPETTKQPPKETQALSDLIRSKKNKEIVALIKEKYKGIKGKDLKILLLVLQELELIATNRMQAQFHTACDIEFDWPICSLQALHKYKELNTSDPLDVDLFNTIKKDLAKFV